MSLHTTLQNINSIIMGGGYKNDSATDQIKYLVDPILNELGYGIDDKSIIKSDGVARRNTVVGMTYKITYNSKNVIILRFVTDTEILSSYTTNLDRDGKAFGSYVKILTNGIEYRIYRGDARNAKVQNKITLLDQFSLQGGLNASSIDYVVNILDTYRIENILNIEDKSGRDTFNHQYKDWVLKILEGDLDQFTIMLIDDINSRSKYTGIKVNFKDDVEKYNYAKKAGEELKAELLRKLKI